MLKYTISSGIVNCPDAKAIRQEVFIDEQKFIDEFDDIDEYAQHVVAYLDEKPVACARFFKSSDSYKIGRIAVIKSMRKKGLGGLIVTYCEEEIKKLGGTKASLSAQVRAMEFYKKLGYSSLGEEYFEEHVAHIMMKKDLI